MRAFNVPFLKRFVNRLITDNSGSAMLLVALGVPMLIGGGGLAVDVTQWYMWKRELQYAVDQAAVAGAWARVRTDTSATYQTRAGQEFAANLSVLKGMTTFNKDTDVGLALYGGGVKTGPNTFVENSVTVHATASKRLPFSGFLTGKAPTIYAYAQAAFEAGSSFTACLEAVDEDADVGITIGGNTVLTAGCGMAALSTSDTSIKVDGSPTVRLGSIESAGGIDDWFKTNDPDDKLYPYSTGLYDPFKDLTPPNPAESQVAGTYTCVHGKTTSTATQTTGVTTTYDYWRGADPINNFAAMTSANTNNRSPNTKTSSTQYVIVDGVPTNGTTTTTTWTKINGSNANTLWERKIVVTDNSYTGVVTTVPPDTALVVPGTFSGGIQIKCNTQFSSGVYILDGGGLKITGQYTVTGSAVMFVLKNGAYIDIAGGSKVTLTAMQASDLIARGVSADDASKLAGMLVFEARDSTSNKNRLNGNSETILNGKIYLPNSNIDFSGTASVTSQCLMIAAGTIRFVGASDMTTFCPNGATDTGVQVGNQPSRVKLVA